jgi:Flp pilus assembly protein TadB
MMLAGGLWLLISRLLPAHPQLRWSMTMLVGHHQPTDVSGLAWESLGSWGLKALPARLRLVPTQDLALVEMTPASFLSRKMVYGVSGLLFPGVLTSGVILLGYQVPIVVPGVVGIALGVVGFMIPDFQVRSHATRRRTEFSRTLACYINLVALERSCGSGTKQALDTAANLGDSWVFRHLKEALDRGSWAGIPPGEALQELGTTLGLPEVSELGDIVSLSSHEGAGIYRILRAKSTSIRESLLLADTAAAHESNEKMSLPVSLLGMIFLVILITPALLSMMILP